MSTRNVAAENTSDREIISTRLLNSPPESIFEAWTNAKYMAEWWGPVGFTNTFSEFNPTPGGAWSFIMHGPNGANYQNECVFVELDKPQKIVMDHVSNPQFRIVATFANEAGKTRYTFRMIFKSAAELEALKKIIVPANEQNIDRLEAVLLKMK